MSAAQSSIRERPQGEGDPQARCPRADFRRRQAVAGGSAASPCAADFSGSGLPDLITARGNAVMGQSDPTGIAYFKNVGRPQAPISRSGRFRSQTDSRRHGRGSLRRRLEWRRIARFGDRRLSTRPSLSQRRQPHRAAVRAGPNAEEPMGARAHRRVLHVAGRLERRWKARSGLRADGHIELKLNVDPAIRPGGKMPVRSSGGQADRLRFSDRRPGVVPAVVDFNGDGLPDLLLGWPTAMLVLQEHRHRARAQVAEGVRLRLKNGGFCESRPLQGRRYGQGFLSHYGDRSCPKAADFNGDGMNGPDGFRCLWLRDLFRERRHERGSLFAPGVKVLHESNDRTMIAVTDWDGDGRPDSFCLTRQRGSIATWAKAANTLSCATRVDPPVHPLSESLRGRLERRR